MSQRIRREVHVESRRSYILRWLLSPDSRDLSNLALSKHSLKPRNTLLSFLGLCFWKDKPGGSERQWNFRASLTGLAPSTVSRSIPHPQRKPSSGSSDFLLWAATGLGSFYYEGLDWEIIIISLKTTLEIKKKKCHSPKRGEPLSYTRRQLAPLPVG